MTRILIFLCVRKTPPQIGPNRLFSVLWKHNALQINAFIFSKNLHNPEVPGSNPGLATKPVTNVTGFFNAKPRNKLAWLSGWALKKTNANRRFVFERLWVRRPSRMTANEVKLAIPLNRGSFVFSEPPYRDYFLLIIQ